MPRKSKYAYVLRSEILFQSLFPKGTLTIVPLGNLYKKFHYSNLIISIYLDVTIIHYICHQENEKHNCKWDSTE